MNGLDDQSRGPAALRRTGLRLVGLTLAMFGLAFALVPLYDVFCEVTGLNGKTGRISAAEAPEAAASHRLRVEFVANLGHQTPLSFEPLTHSLEVAAGEIREVRYRVANPGPEAVVARAVPSVAPALASRYFNKIECFCFQEQLIEAGQQLEMPARFVIDPDIPANVRVLTLAYTFFAQPATEARATGAAATAAVQGRH